VAFHLPEDAVKWCLDIQVQLNDIAWSPTILNATKHDQDQVNFRGLRVRAGANTGTAKKVRACLCGVKSREETDRGE
jgi:hypothetical protein